MSSPPQFCCSCVTAYGVCARFTAEWTTLQLVDFYSISASLAELAVESMESPDAEILSGALHCRFAVLAGKMEEARSFETNVDRVSSSFDVVNESLMCLRRSLRSTPSVR